MNTYDGRQVWPKRCAERHLHFARFYYRQYPVKDLVGNDGLSGCNLS